MNDLPLLYSDIAAWWPVLSPPAEYEEEAGVYTEMLLSAAEQPPRTVLELGSGGGNNASFMKSRFDMTLVDLSDDMLKVSRALNHECTHLKGDMRSVRLEREFDAVFIHDAICYMTTAEDLTAAITTAYVHTRPGGVALFCPDFVRENFREATDHGGHDDAGRALRYLEWVWDPDPSDSTYFVDYAYILREEDGGTRSMHERHEEGLFGQDEWTRIMMEVGFEPAVFPFEHSEIDYGSVAILGKKPA